VTHAIEAPPYGSGTLADVLPSTASLWGVQGFRDTLDLVGRDPGRSGGPPEAVTVLLIDGMGWWPWHGMIERTPTLAAMGRSRLSTTVPSTTPTALASLGTGVQPGAHGIVGASFRVPEDDLMLQPLASAAAVMCEQDLEAGVAIVDIGGGTTDLAVFYEGILKQTAVIPFGGENITTDIKNGLGVLRTHAERMKVQFGSALADEAQSNAFISIPGLRGLPSRDISVKNLAHIIQARMSEILDFVSYNLRQVGIDGKMLNGGIVLTGGGSQLKHLIQLTEYVTGMNARIGYPNEHLTAGHTEELAKPMYSTCLGLILKGYNVYENSRNKLRQEEVPSVQPQVQTTVEAPEQSRQGRTVMRVRGGRTLKNFMDSIKDGLIEMFREEGDRNL
jgi:hypothetical protein